MVAIWLAALIGAAALAIGIGIGNVMRKRFAERQIGSAETQATRIINEAIRSGESR